MSEHPISPPSALPERPVPDPTLFLLNHGNRAFVEGRNRHPILDEASQRRTLTMLGATLSVPMIGGLLLLNLEVIPVDYTGWFCLGVMGVLMVIFGGYLYYLRSDLNLQGTLYSGVVVRSEKIRMVLNNRQRERFGVWYRFVGAGGRIQEGYAEADSDTASQRMAPQKGMEVWVWGEEDGRCYLL